MSPRDQSEQVFPELIRMAVRQGWKVSAQNKRKTVDEITREIQNPDTTIKTRIKLTRLLLFLEKQGEG